MANKKKPRPAASLANLKPYVKGDPRIYREGKKKLPALKKLIDKLLGEDEKGKSEAENIIRNLIKLAKKKTGERAADILLTRAYGLPAQKQIFEGPDGQPLPTTIEVKVFNTAPPLARSENEIDNNFPGSSGE